MNIAKIAAVPYGIAVLALMGISLQLEAQSIDLRLQSDVPGEPDPPPLLIPLDPAVPVDLDVGTGDLEATAEAGFVCASGCDEVDVSLASADEGFFRVNGGSAAQVDEGGSVRFDWRARGAWTCSGTLRDSAGAVVTGTSWPGSGKLPFGPETVVMSVEPDTYSATITCSNGPENDTAGPLQVEVSPSDLDIPPECQGRQPGGAAASNVCWKGNEQVNCFSYDDVFGEFPGSSNAVEFFQENGTYTAMGFDTTGLTATSGSWVFDLPQFDVGGQGPKLMTISECPGDFDRDAIQQEMGSFCYEQVQGLTNLRWKRAGTTGARCELDLNTQYYLNILYSTDPEGTAPADLTWDCSGNATDDCGNLMAPAVSQ